MPDPVQTQSQVPAVGNAPQTGQIVGSGTPSEQQAAPDTSVPATAATPQQPVAPMTPAQAAPGTAAGLTPQPPTAGQTAKPTAGQTTRHVLGEIFQTLAGGQKTVWEQTPNGPVPTKVDLKPGEMARGILAAAITGLAGGYDPANRGKGPAMASAFSGGFKANQERVEKQEGKQEQEAQQEFKNQGLSEERQLAAHRDALAQQESIRAAQKHNIDMQVTKANLERGERLDAEHIADRDAADSTKLIDAKNSGGVPVKGADGTVLAFKSDHDLMQYVQASDANAARVFGTSQLMNTERLRDPSTGMIYVYQRPIDDHTPRWMGVEVDKDGKPVLDKEGKMQIDKANPWYGPDGKARVPASKMTPADFNADLRSSQQIRGQQLVNQRNWIEIQKGNEEYKQMMKNDNAQQLAEKHLAEAGDDLDNPILTADDKNYMMNTTLHQSQGTSVLLKSLEDEINKKEEADPKDKELPALRAQASTARQQLQQYQSQAQMLSKSGTQSIIDYQRRIHGDDIDAIKKDISTLPPAQQKIVLDGVKKPALPESPRLQKAIKDILDPMENNADRAAAIANFPTNTVQDKNLLYKYYGITPPANTASMSPTNSQLEGIGANYSMVKMADGSTQKVANNLVPDFVSKGATLIGQGTEAKSTTEVEREK